jgi:serine/threonine protein kinase/tetratricopeptide (TPR) repeat protein
MAETYPLKFGKYVLLKPMARGGMGAIFLAAAGEPGFQKFCVVKKVLAEKNDRAKSNRFLDEAKVVLRLSHANLVPTFDAGEVDGEFFIAMELVEGKDLREIWNRCVRTRTRIPLDVALHVAREICRALAYVHSHADLRLVHRDVAPPNILISYFGEVKLTDFGLARSVLKQENTAPGVVFGRASYLSPEQARGEVADARTDIYSLGIVLWELVTGNQYLQLANLDPATAMSLVRHPRAQPPSSKAPWITPNLDALLMRALAPDREQRFQSAEEMRKALSDIITQISPRADAERTADFLRGLYDTLAKEERAERDKLLAESAALLPAPTPRQSARMPVPLSLLESGSTKLQFPKEDDSMGVDFTGRVIDSRYRVIRKIGEGGMGTVYAGEHVEIGKDVAIKILHPAYSTQQDLVERFRREARAASRIGHPHIIDVTDFGETEDGCAYFVMEHLDGIDLADVLSHERRLAPERACKIATQICRALAAAHAAGVIHRDLKPENIFLVARDGQADFVKVLDFGIARSMGRARRLTNPGVAMGTPEYMAPEQAEGGAVDQRSDIYSVGALIYEMVSGSPPQMSRDKELIPPRGIKADVPEELDRIVVRALEADPAHRYQSMAQFEYDLVKSLFGRSRAVSEMLGLHDQERGVVPEISYSDEAPGGTHPRADSPPAAARRPPSPVPPPAWEEERGSRGGDAGVSAASVTGATRDSGGGWRYAGTFAALALVGVAAVTIYRRLPWSARAQTAASPIAAVTPSLAPAQPSDADRRAQRLRSGVADVERMLGSGFGFAQLPALQDQLGRLRADGGSAIADTLATRAKGLLVKAAEEELDRGEIEAGVAHYRIALALDAHGGGEAELVAALRTRAQSALSANKDTEALRWAREVVAFSGGSAEAHALLAECLHALREDGEAVTEYEKALATRPDDPTFTHGLSAARHALATDSKREHTSHAHRSATSTATSAPAPVEAQPGEPSEAAAPPSDQPSPQPSGEAPDRERPAAKPEDHDDKRPDERSDKSDDKAASEKAAPSAPAEPAPDQQH